MVLDPRFKLKGFSTASSAANAKMILIKECKEHLSKLSSASRHDQPQPNVASKINLFCGVVLMKYRQKVKEFQKDMILKIQQKSWLKCIYLKNHCYLT